MGKSKLKKISNRVNPVGIPSVRDLILEEGEEAVDISSKSTFFDSVIDQLKSHSGEERDAGLFSLEESWSTKVVIDEFLRRDILSIVIPLLLDNSLTVRCGAGRVLGKVALTPELADIMIQNDVMTPLIALFKQNYTADWQPRLTGKQIKKYDAKSAVFMGAVNLLWKLSENSPKVIEIFNREGILPILVKSLDVETFGTKISSLSAECLLSITENNKKIAESIDLLDSALQKIISRIPINDDEKKDPDWMLLQTTTVGILMNLREANLITLSPTNFAMAMKILANVLSLDRMEPVMKVVNEIKPEFEVAKVETELEEHVKRVSSIFSSQKSALMFLSNLLAEDDGDGDDDSQYEESEEDESDLNEEAMECTMDCDENMTIGLIPEVYEIIRGENLVSKIFEKIQTTLPPNVIETLSNHRYAKGILQDWDELRYTALLFLQNLVGCEGTSEIIGFEMTKQIWVSLQGVLAEEINKDNTENRRTNDIIEAVTSVYRAIMQKWAEEKVTVPIEQDKAWFDGVFQLFGNVYKTTTIGKIRINTVKIIGSFGIIASTSKPTEFSILLVESVVGFLINCLSEPLNEEHLPVVAETLDTIFDVFSEDDYNMVLKKSELIKKLKAFSSIYKSFAEKKTMKLGEYKAIVQTSKTNLPRFIRYKQKHGCA